jgi:hypothetical protein
MINSNMGTLMIENILPYILPMDCGSMFPRICHGTKDISDVIR